MNTKKLLYLYAPLGLIASIFIFYANNHAFFTNLYLLPFFYAIVCLSVYHAKEISFPFTCIVSVYFIRNTLTPVIMCLGDYSSYFIVSSKKNVDYAIMLMIYESTIAVLYSFFQNKESYSPPPPDEKINRTEVFFNINQNLAVCITFAFFLLIYILRRKFFDNYSSVYFVQEIRQRDVLENGGPLDTLFSVLFPISYLFISLYFINYSIHTIKRAELRSLLCILLSSVPLLFMNNADGFNVICLLSLLYVSFFKKGVTRKDFVVVNFAIVLIVLYILLSISSLSYNAESKDTMQKVSSFLLAYFPGVTNISGGFDFYIPNKIETLFYDFYATIPFRNTIFGLKNDLRLVMLYTEYNDSLSQVLPCIIQLYTYLGVFAPIIDCILIKCAYLSYEKSQKAKTVYISYAYILLFFYLVLTPVSYNITIFLSRFNVTILPMLLLYSAVIDTYSLDKKDQLAQSVTVK